MLKINKIITKSLFILSISFFLASNAFAGGVINEISPVESTSQLKIENNKGNEVLNLNLSSPTILSPKNDDIISYNETITGAVSSGAVVRIYIDGILDGEIKSWESKTGISAFFYTPKKHLSEGIHFLKAQAVKNGFISDFSKEVMIIKEAVYDAPVVRAPYYYKDDYKTFVVRGIANSKDTIDIYLDGKKIKTLNLPESTSADKKVSFLYAIHNLTDGKHSGYFVAYENMTGRRSYDSKKFYFEVKQPEVPSTSEAIKPNSKETTNDGSLEDTTKKDTVNNINNTTKDNSNNIVSDQKPEEKTLVSPSKDNADYQRDKSMTIGIVLLVCSVILMIFWVYSENQDKIKRVIDKLLDEDYEDEKDNKNKK